MARVYLHGVIENAARFADAIPVLAWLFDQIESALNGGLDDTNLKDSAVTTAKIKDAAVTAAKLAASAVTSAAVDSTVAKIASGQYTGDATQSREINLGWRARHVVIIRHDNSTRFEAWGTTSSALARIQTTSAGVTTDGGTDFTGSSTNGFTLGSAVGGGGSNASGQTYSYIAIG